MTKQKASDDFLNHSIALERFCAILWLLKLAQMDLMFNYEKQIKFVNKHSA